MEDEDAIQRFALSPNYALYRAIDRFFALRVSGHGAEQALQAVLTCIDSIRDTDYDNDIRSSMNGNGDYEWDVMRAVLRLLKRKNLWLNPPQALIRGQELLAAID